MEHLSKRSSKCPSRLRILFDLVKTHTRRIRKKHLRYNKSAREWVIVGFDGKKFWEPIKINLQQYDHLSSTHWKKINPRLVKYVSTIPEFDDSHEMIEENHFIIQQIRIPTTEPISIRKIIQVALNIGQWTAYPNRTMGTKPIRYIESGLDKLQTYVPIAVEKYLSKLITDDTIETIKSYCESY